MEYLTKNYWKNFKKDGKLFEKLSKTLIEYEFNAKDFVIVGGPGDNGSDITKKVELLDGVKTEIWAQCKFHNNSLSFNDISFTLLMAYIKNTNQILVFSYSKVTKDFLEHLDEYRSKTGKSVIVYSDTELEKLIFKHKNKLESEHKEYFDSFPAYVEEKEYCFTYNYQVYINGKNINHNYPIINLNTLCELVITVTNKSSCNKLVKIEPIKSRISNNFIFLNEKEIKSINIAAFDSYTLKFYVKLRKFTKRTSLPNFYLKCNDSQIKICSNIKLSCRWLADTVLIGNKYYKAINEITNGIKSSHFNLSIIYGKSGVGKSRILRESAMQGIISNKKVISIDSEKRNFSCESFMKLICSQITQLPLFKEKIDFLSDTQDDTIVFASNILYKHNVDFEHDWIRCSDFLTTALTEDSYVLILDNVQHFDKTSLQIIERTLTYLAQTASTTTVILGINTDFIYKDSYFDKLFFKMKCAATNNAELYSVIELNGFEENDAELYVRECLSYRPENQSFSVIQYDRTIKEIVTHCDKNPFYLQQFLLYLEQEDIIKFSEHTLYYIYDLNKFSDSFKYIPLEINELIVLREQSLISTFDKKTKKRYEDLIYLLNITKALSLDLYYEIIKDKTLLDRLFDLGFLTITENSITFIHSFYSMYYKDKYNVDSISTKLLELFDAAVCKFKYQQIFALPLYWSRYKLGTINYQDSKEVAIKLATGNFDCVSNFFCLLPLCRIMNSNFKEIGSELYLRAYECLCGKIDETIGMKRSPNFYDMFINVFTNDIISFEGTLDGALSLVTNYLIHLINLENYTKCFNTMDKLLHEANVLSEIAVLKINYQINRCKIMIYNRNDQVSEAINVANDCMRILENPKTPIKFKERYIYSAKRSIGNTYFYSTKAGEKRAEIAKSWNDSFNSYAENYGFDIYQGYSEQPKVSAVAKGLAADMITEEETLGDEKMEFFVNAFDRMNMMYYEMQIRLLVAMYKIWKHSSSPYYNEALPDIIRYIDQSIDIAAIYGRELTTINAFHLKGVAYFLADNYSLAAENYCIAADMLSNYLSTDKDYERWNYFWTDMARALKKAKQNVIIGQMGITSKIFDKIKNIIKMEEHLYLKFENEFIPCTALTDKSFYVNFPKI